MNKMNKIIINLKCPKCHFPARAEVKNKLYKFLIYTCPKCSNNVVYYKNKVDILSNKYVESLRKKKKLQFCGDALFPLSKNIKKKKTEEITQDKIIDLKILLETEKDVDTFLSKI